ncbi:MAG: hypothetical protein CYPHOPRED_000123 [Cyphobasidiales sp. Tagirdzhanova-0007]|nr:MAG: hypothetical protein CYPHOPRED_000123 [Cyphobasidiales sp. Tagirdzhanova-0007]
MAFFKRLSKEKRMAENFKTPLIDLTGRTVIVTGGNAGIGFEACRIFTQMNPEKLVIAARSESRGAQASKLIAGTPGAKCTPDVWPLDLTSLTSVEAFAKRCISELRRLDVLLLNAGVAMTKDVKTLDGYETKLQVNGIATALLARLLLPLLQRSAVLPSPPGSSLVSFKPHITISASHLYRFITKLPEDGSGNVINGMNENFSLANTYNQTKLIAVLIVQTVAQIAGQNVIVNNGDPGYCETDLGKSGNFIFNAISDFMHRWARTPEQGAKAAVYACITDMPTGAYCEHMDITTPSDFVSSEPGRKLADQVYREMNVIWKDKLQFTA